MSRKKSEVLSRFVSIIEEMAPIVKWAKLDKYLRICENVDDVAYKHILAAEKWVSQIYAHEYRDVYSVWKFLPEEKWTRYRDWDLMNDMREARLLTSALIILGKALRETGRPELMKPSKWAKLLEKKNVKHNKAKKIRKVTNVQPKKARKDADSARDK